MIIKIKKLILFNIQKENECDPGLPVDLVFVNNNVGNVEGNEFVDKLNNKKLKNEGWKPKNNFFHELRKFK